MTLGDRQDMAAINGIRAIQSMRESAEKAGLSEMSLDEINAEIAASRRERHARKAGGAQ